MREKKDLKLYVIYIHNVSIQKVICLLQWLFRNLTLNNHGSQAYVCVSPDSNHFILYG